MNKSKFISAVVVTVLTMGTGIANAQDKPVTIGVKAGINLSNFGGDMKDTKSVFKYQFGITADIRLLPHFYLLTGLDLQTKGVKYNPKSQPSAKYNPMYLQLPAHLGYKIDLTPGSRLVVNAGPYIAYGIGGRVKSDGNSEKLFGGDKLNRLDYGAGGGLGFEIGKFSINGGYDLGLKNISDMKGTKIKNRNTYLTFGYKF